MTFSSKTLMAVSIAAALGAAAVPGASFAQTSAVRGKILPGKPPMPLLRLNEKSNGEAAIAKLGSRLPEVAAHYGKSVSEFAKQLRTDRSAWIDKEGRLLFVEEGMTSSGNEPTPSGAVFSLDKTFLLHSRPLSKRKIYLDFNGHTTTGTAWNASYGVTTINSPAFDLDGVPGTFSTAELTMIQNIWRRVAEDYAAFDVDVTTEEPPADQMVRSSSTDLAYGARALITKNFTAGTTKGDCGCGGFAYVGVYDATSEYNKTAWVFQDKLGNGEKSIAEATSHEVGHNLGLSHDGTATVGYYQGHGTGATGWAPIMGVGYNKELVQFSKGEYSSANNKEDDFLIMQGNGVAFAADDFGGTNATAATLSGTPSGAANTYDARGVIETPSDMDMFKFTSGAGSITINATPFDRSPNLDILIQLRDAAGNLLAQANPATTLNGAITVSVPAAGTYYLSIQGSGLGDPLSTGYSAYGSIGRYTIAVSAPAAAAATSAPVAVINTSATTGPAPLTVSFSASASTSSGSPITSYVWSFGDSSGPVSGMTVSHPYNRVGNFTATLKVTNSAGLVDSKSVLITTTSGQPTVFADSIAMSTARSLTGQTYAQARVTVRDLFGKAIPNATVSGSWSGIVTGNSAVVTNINGVALLSSPSSLLPGTYKFTITGISASGYAYDASRNRMTSNSITR